MITGRITEDLEPLVNDAFASLRDGTLLPIRTTLDTGFNGWFCMPRVVMSQMLLEPASIEIYELADGSIFEENTYYGEVIIANQPHFVKLTGTDSDTALMGMAMLLEKEAVFNLKDMTVKVM